MNQHKILTPEKARAATPLTTVNRQFLGVLKDSVVKLVFESALRQPSAEPALPMNSSGDKALGAFTRYVLAVAHEHDIKPHDILKELGLTHTDKEQDAELATLLKQEAARWNAIEQQAYGHIEKGGVAALKQGAATKMDQAVSMEG
ncbi:hypothetical protein SmJEL517_g00469 [Synchytrium microbalum]|uniref:Uncharacterized protein n=1 Tax=Synchytrium microbalum TaxID=1806994 RepID=A0A507CID8_9FUNG|nr:uncharacterized protein SmJEL517_g00469 [Synchytrium microbalum]TPX37413.1 hypothetical protein SmJEL517_g00469 [Synchytrium microbalum]